MVSSILTLLLTHLSVSLLVQASSAHTNPQRYVRCASMKYARRNDNRRMILDDIGFSPEDQKIMEKATGSTHTIDVYFHLICSPKSRTECPIEKEVKNQFQIMQRSMATINFKLKLGGIYTDWNEKVYKIPVQDGENGLLPVFKQYAMSQHNGTVRDLNVYVTNLDIDQAAGINAFLPSTLTKEKHKADGIVIDYRTMPILTNTRKNVPRLEKYNRGFSAVHEMGHWLGLLHTFTNGCNGRDIRYGITDDTPPEDYSLYLSLADSKLYESCQKLQSCDYSKKYNLFDPTDNFMDYSPDACMRRFTKGQKIQAQFSFMKWRMAK